MSRWTSLEREVSFDISLSHQLVAASLDNAFVLSCVSYYVYDAETHFRAVRYAVKSLESAGSRPGRSRSPQAGEARPPRGCMDTKPRSHLQTRDGDQTVKMGTMKVLRRRAHGALGTGGSACSLDTQVHPESAPWGIIIGKNISQYLRFKLNVHPSSPSLLCSLSIPLSFFFFLFLFLFVSFQTWQPY